MNSQQLIAHLNAHSATYRKDAEYWQGKGDTHLASFADGKAEAFATAASWIAEVGL